MSRGREGKPGPLPREAGQGGGRPPRWPEAASVRCTARRGSGGCCPAGPSYDKGRDLGYSGGRPAAALRAQSRVGVAPAESHPREAPPPNDHRHGPSGVCASRWVEPAEEKERTPPPPPPPPPPRPAPACDRERGRAAAARPQRSPDPGCAQPRPWPAHPPGSLQRPGRPSSFVPRASWRGEPGGEERKRVKGNRLSEIYPLLQFLEQI